MDGFYILCEILNLTDTLIYHRHRSSSSSNNNNNNDDDDDDVQRPGEWVQQDVVRTKIVPVINGALGTFKEGLDQNP